MKTLLGLLVTTWLATGCGSVAGGGDITPDAGPIDEEDTTAPTVVSISPTDGATGVRADAAVVFVFSEPMDQLSVQNSLDTADLGVVSFAWSDGGATLTITPNDPLPYATGAGNDPSVTTAEQLAVTVGTGATDVVGNSLQTGVQTMFSTLKSMSTSLGRDNALTAAGAPTGVITDADDFLYVGDDGAGGTAAGYRGYITIDLSPLPATAVEIASARLSAYQLSEVGNPYGALGAGGVVLEHTIFTLGDSASDNAAFNVAALSQIGTFASAGATSLGIDVSAQAHADLQNRADRHDRSQYRLRFSEFTNLDDTADYVLIGRDEIALDLVYLAP